MTDDAQWPKSVVNLSFFVSVIFVSLLTQTIWQEHDSAFNKKSLNRTRNKIPTIDIDGGREFSYRLLWWTFITTWWHKKWNQRIKERWGRDTETALSPRKNVYIRIFLFYFILNRSGDCLKHDGAAGGGKILKHSSGHKQGGMEDEGKK